MAFSGVEGPHHLEVRGRAGGGGHGGQVGARRGVEGTMVRGAERCAVVGGEPAMLLGSGAKNGGGGRGCSGDDYGSGGAGVRGMVLGGGGGGVSGTRSSGVEGTSTKGVVGREIQGCWNSKNAVMMHGFGGWRQKLAFWGLNCGV